jgi:glyoxylase-like metal-dependent hydrolase (beta-lactamase superfamily II)
VTLGDCRDVYYVDVDAYGIEAYGAVYVLDAEEPAVVDTGLGRNYPRVLEALSTLGIDPADLSYIVPTHVHLDHAGGAGYLARACPDARVLVHELGVRHLVDPDRLVEGTKRAVGPEQWQYYEEPVPIDEDRIDGLGGGETIDLGDYTLEVHHAPGHAPHQVVIENPENDLVFTADAAGNWLPSPEPGAVRALSPPPDFDLEQCLADVDLLRRLDRNVLCYAHFGPTPLEADISPNYEGTKLDLYEAVLVDWVDAIETKREELESDEAVVDYFAARNGVTHRWHETEAYSGTAMNVRGVLHYLDHHDG